MARLLSEKYFNGLTEWPRNFTRFDWLVRIAEVEVEIMQHKRETLMREGALRKPMLVEPPKKQRSPPIDSTRTDHSLKRKWSSNGINDDRPPKKQRPCDGPKLTASAMESSLRETNAIRRGDVGWKKRKVMPKNNVKKAKGSTKNSPKKKEPIGSPSTPPKYHDLPDEFKREIATLKGTRLGLVIEKRMTMTDISPGENRLSMPEAQIVSMDFLEGKEKELLEGQQTMKVQLIDPGLVKGDINLRLWHMKSSKLYVLRTQWGAVAQRNKLKPGQLVQVWSFRVNGALYLALVLVKESGVKGDRKESDGSDSGGRSIAVEGETSGGSGGGTKIMEEKKDENNGNASAASTVINGSDHASPNPGGDHACPNPGGDHACPNPGGDHASPNPSGSSKEDADVEPKL